MVKDFYSQQKNYFERNQIDPKARKSLIKDLHNKIRPLRNEIIHHKIFSQLKTPQHLQWVMENHVFLIWSHTSALKKLHDHFNFSSYFWAPQKHCQIHHFINHMFLDSISIQDRRLGHYSTSLELYISSMKQAQCSTTSIHHFLNMIHEGFPCEEFTEGRHLSLPTKNLLLSVCGFLENKNIIPTLLWYIFGQQDILPCLYPSFIQSVPEESKNQFDLWTYFLDESLRKACQTYIPMCYHILMYYFKEKNQQWDDMTHYACESFEIWIEFLDDLLHCFPSDDKSEVIQTLAEDKNI